jgi:hypothetical protein
MSYLDVPRLHFSGTFIAKPSTVNNTPQNFDPKVTNPSPAWNPNGNHAWQFLNCQVKTAVNASCQILQSNSDDPVIGAAVSSTDEPINAKLVDLDTEQQMVSQVWGLQIKVAVSDTEYFVGNFRVVPFNDIFVRVVGGQPDSMFSAYYQSVLDLVTWSDQISSPFLQALQQASPGALSIKFVVDGYDDDSNSPTFNQGRIVGTIGPAFADEPPNFVLGRYLRPAGFNPQNPFNGTPLWFGPAKVDENRRTVMVDLGNSIPTMSPAGPPLSNLGTLQVAIMTSPNPTVIGNYDYSNAAYLATAGVQEFTVTPEQLVTLKETPLGVTQTGVEGSSIEPGETVTLLQENANGAYINATQQVYRMNPGDIEVVELIALRFGKPAVNEKVSLAFNNGALQPVPKIPTGKPAKALKFPGSVKTGDEGRASFTLTASDPGNPRKFIDGQVYAVGYSWSAEDDANFPPDPNNFVSVLVFDTFEKEPTWENLKPIFEQYAKLYPFMKNLLNIADYMTDKENIASLLRVLNIPITDPRYMPVTRDMSRDKRQTIINWLNSGAPGPV